MHLTSWPCDTNPELPPILNRLHSLFPPQDVQTHLLHLASNGEIHPHIDNITASGSWILGVSLGAERMLHLENQKGDDSYQVLLPSGSVYMQRHVRIYQGVPLGLILSFTPSDSLRFDYKHSIPLKGTYDGREIHGRQRVSIMIRVRASSSGINPVLTADLKDRLPAVTKG
ncbi:hypothetical protein B0H17DRAFT_140120 [Mycena rosella]|uniref:Alpha-ketoglutarate-dependent dioxygenase AlkB-like domain-containing protein n=1 Tax=Mycena rosella TaxID=1033263 RepID=A0AAD7GQ05_MYCRO|nr:hypothetical protein B0H17DRAFT_140120 [Mycena rosella]